MEWGVHHWPGQGLRTSSFGSGGFNFDTAPPLSATGPGTNNPSFPSVGTGAGSFGPSANLVLPGNEISAAKATETSREKELS